MTTYKKISEAFKNGSGDVFYTKDNQYLAVSRKDDHTELLNLGFVYVSYDDIMTIAAAQNPVIIKVKPAIPTVKKTHGKMCSNDHYNFYDEYPDAYGQSL